MDLPTVWFCLLSGMVAMYVVFDGFDLGAGIVHMFVARDADERALVRRSLGPVWDGNEVWLLAAGGTLYFAFPAVYARAFSGFYLPLMMLLWLLILRGVSLELAGHVKEGLWQPFWSGVFGLSSLLLAIVFGAALGNVVRGVPMRPDGTFFEPLWTHGGTAGETGILDWYTVLVGVAAMLVLTLHGALWVVLKTEGGLRDRCRVAATRLVPVVALVVAVLTWATMQVQPHVAERLVTRPWGFVFPALGLAGLLAVWRFHRRGEEGRAFRASAVFLVGLMASAVFGLYPYLLPAHTDPALGLTVSNSAAAPYGLRVGLWWWIPGMALVALYTTLVYRRFAGKVSLADEGYH